MDPNTKSTGNALETVLINSRQLHCLTGRSYREEATKHSFDLLTAVQMRRHHWLGHILQMPTDRVVCRVVLALGQRAGPPYQPGSLLMDTPLPLHELVLRAAKHGHELTDPSPHCRKAPKPSPRGETLQIIINKYKYSNNNDFPPMRTNIKAVQTG